MWDEFQWTGGQNHQHLKNHPPIVPSDPHGRNITLQASQASRSEWSSGTSMLEGVEGWFKWLETLETPVVEWCFVWCKNVLNGGYKVEIKSWEVQFRVSAWCFKFRETRRRESSSCWVLIRMWFTRQQYGRSKVPNPTNFSDLPTVLVQSMKLLASTKLAYHHPMAPLSVGDWKHTCASQKSWHDTLGAFRIILDQNASTKSSNVINKEPLCHVGDGVISLPMIFDTSLWLPDARIHIWKV